MTTIPIQSIVFIRLTKIQKKALKLLNNIKKILHHHYGGARAGKTFLDCRYFVLRAIRYPGTRQLFCRASKSSCITSIWMQTLLPMLQSKFKGMWTEDKSKRIINFFNGSSIWAGGFDNVQHTDELLAKEWAGILVEEASELSYINFIKLLSRLNWNPAHSKIPLKMVLEANPPRKTHWLYKYFFNYIDYETGEKLSKSDIDDIEKLHFSPEDNKENLNPKYLQKLRNLKGTAGKRFYDGIYADDVKGRIYEFDRKVNLVDEPIEYDPKAELWRAWDFGIYPSSTAIIWIQIKTIPKTEEFPDGYIIEILDYYESTNKDYKHYADECKKKPYGECRDAGDPSGKNRDAALKSWISRLREEGIHIQQPKGKPGTDDRISNANLHIPYMRVCEYQNPKIVEMFETWAKPKDKDGKVIECSKPEHNEYSHPGTAYYYWDVVKFPYKKGHVFLP